MLVHINDLWRDIFIASSADNKDPAKVIRDYVRNKLEFGRQHPNASRVFSNEVAAGGHYLRKHWHSSRESTRAAAEIIQSWIDKKLIKPVDPTDPAVAETIADSGRLPPSRPCRRSSRSSRRSRGGSRHRR